MVQQDTFTPVRESYAAPPYTTPNWLEELLLDDTATALPVALPAALTSEPIQLEETVSCSDFTDIFVDDGNLPELNDASFLADLQAVLDVPPVHTTHPDGSFPLSLAFEWTHKKGKRKPQQFWVYCEEKQVSYARLTLTSPTQALPGWSAASRAFTYQGQLHLVRHYRAKAAQQSAIVLLFQPTTGTYQGQFCDVPTTALLAVDRNAVEFDFVLEADRNEPAHPAQGNPADVQVRHETADFEFCELREPFQHNATFAFKNRSEGWFRLQASLSFCGVPLVTARSEPFMFNNPRLKKRKELAAFPTPVVKFLQVYALATDNHQMEHWLTKAQALRLPVTSDMLQLARGMFVDRKRKRPTSVAPSSPKRPCVRTLAMPAQTLEDPQFCTVMEAYSRSEH